MKILHVHVALYLPLVYTRELQKRNITAKTLYLLTSGLEWLVDRPDFDFSPVRKITNLSHFLNFLFFEASKFDVIHFHSEPGFTPYSFLGRLNAFLGMPDMRFLQSKNVKIVFSRWGCFEGRLPSNFLTENEGKICENCKTGLFGKTCSDKVTRFKCEMQEKFADHILTHEPDFNDFNQHAQYHPAIVDFDSFNNEIEIPREFLLNKDPDSFLVYHSVGQAQKRGNERGTQIIVKTIEQMRKDGFNIHIISTNGRVPYKQIGFYQRQADIAVDHLYYNWYGNMARECMAQAVPVATHLDPGWINNHLKFYQQAPPIINVDEKNLRDVLEFYIANRQALQDIGRQQQKYVQDIHGTDQVIDRLLKIYSS